LLEFRHNVSYKKKLEWWGYKKVKKFEDVFSCFYAIHERYRHPDGRTDRHRAMA